MSTVSLPTHAVVLDVASIQSKEIIVPTTPPLLVPAALVGDLTAVGVDARHACAD
jgi:hypothetical protein